MPSAVRGSIPADFSAAPAGNSSWAGNAPDDSRVKPVHADRARAGGAGGGGNGMVGRALLRELTSSGAYQRIIALSRRPLAFEAARLVNRIIRFETIESELRGLACNDAFCCLGTTLREAGSQQAFRAIDYDLVLQFARFAQSSGARAMVAVSAAGAAPEAR